MKDKVKEKLIDGTMVELKLSKDNISEDGNTITGISILSRHSIDSSGKVVREFTDRALDDAVNVFENCLARIDHDRSAKQPRGVKTSFGVYHNIRRTEDKVVGDLTLWDCMEAKKVKSIAERTPYAVGNSIHAGGMARMDSERGIEIVESILARTAQGWKPSVDLVDDPAATLNLYEDKNKFNEKGNDMEFKDITLDQLKVNRPDLVTSIVDGKDDKIKELTEERDKLKVENDELKLKDTLASRQAMIDKIVKESELPEVAVTDSFKEQLKNVSESKDEDFKAKVKELCADRKKVIESVKGGVNNNHSRDLNEDKDKGKGKTSDDLHAVLSDNG